jgi:hypothetical protein
MSSPIYKLATHAWYINIVAWRSRIFCPHCGAPLGVFHILAACQLCDHLHHACVPLESLHYSCPWLWQPAEVVAFINQNWPCAAYLNILWIQQYVTFQLPYNRKICSFVASLTYMVIRTAMTGPCTLHYCLLCFIYDCFQNSDILGTRILVLWS